MTQSDLFAAPAVVPLAATSTDEPPRPDALSWLMLQNRDLGKVPPAQETGGFLCEVCGVPRACYGYFDHRWCADHLPAGYWTWGGSAYVPASRR